MSRKMRVHSMWGMASNDNYPIHIGWIRKLHKEIINLPTCLHVGDYFFNMAEFNSKIYFQYTRR